MPRPMFRPGYVVPMRALAPFVVLLAACDSTAPPRPDIPPPDSGTEPVTLVILAPADASTWFLGTRYDIVVQVSGAEDWAVTVDGATATCAPPDAGLLHCTVVPDTAGPVTVRATAGDVLALAEVTARAAVGIVPEGEAFAMGAYELMQEDWFAATSPSFNLAQSYGTGAYAQLEWQAWAAAAGMWTMTRPSWSWSDPWGDISDSATLAALADRPELAWWEIPELPVEDDAWVEQVGELVEVIRAHDDRPTQMYFWTSSTAEHIAAYVPDVTVISPGTYPAHACQVQPWIRWRIASAREAVALAGYSEAERPVVGTADLYNRPEGSCPERAAELAHVRMNPLAMIAAGARGILYFAWWYAETDLEPEWKASALDTAELITGESGLGFAVIHGEALGDLDVTVLSGPQQSAAFTPAHASAEVQFGSIHAAAWDYAGTRFVVAVNYTDEAVTAEIAGLPAEHLGIEVVGEDRSLTSTEGVMTDTFAAWGAHVYRTPIVRPE